MYERVRLENYSVLIDVIQPNKNVPKYTLFVIYVYYTI